MMRNNYVFSVGAREVITTMFFASCDDHNIKISFNDKDALRCAITVLCNDIKNYLVEYLDVDLDEFEEQAIRENPDICCNCKHSEMIMHCNEHDIDVDGCDGCSDWEEHEHFDLDESDPGKWEIEKTVVYPRKGGE